MVKPKKGRLYRINFHGEPNPIDGFIVRPLYRDAGPFPGVFVKDGDIILMLGYGPSYGSNTAPPGWAKILHGELVGYLRVNKQELQEVAEDG